jgi:predicted transcriptional regulator
MENEFNEIWARIKAETNLKSLQSLANIVKISQPAVSEMKGKGKFPPGWAYLVGKEFGLLTEWIMTGEGPKRLSDRQEINPILVEVNEWLKEEVRKNPKKGIWFEVEFGEKFQEFSEWKRKRDQGESGGDIFPSSKVA